MNTNITPAFHGSDLEKIAAYYHIPQESIINFGANVNPLGLSPSVKSALADNLDVITPVSGQGLQSPSRNHSCILQRQH